MMFIAINKPVPKRTLNALKRRATYLNGLPTIDKQRQYVKDTDGWGLLKQWLTAFGHGKCWYCEASSHRSPLAVDHFRPKLAVTVHRSGLLNHHGYYWLAYDWENYRVACSRCNSPESDEDVLYGKHNEFALLDEAGRINSPSSTMVEAPLFLDPCVKSDTELLAHLESGEVHPTAIDPNSDEYKRARYTIDTLGLNSYGVPKSKRTKWQTLDLLIRLADYRIQAAAAPIAGEVADVVENVKEYLTADTEYATFFRAAIGSHQNKGWVKNLL